MTWLFWAFLCAASEAVKDLTSKRGLRALDPLSISWVFFSITTLLCAPLLLFEPIPDLDHVYWICLFVHGSLYGLSVFLYMKALSLAPISMTVPLIMVTPLFMLMTSPLVLGEWPNRLGLLGTVFIVVGSYLLNIKSVRFGPLAPFKALLVEPGARLMLLVAFIWSITSVIDKLGIQHSSPLFWGITLYCFISFLMTVLLLRRPAALRNLLPQWRYLLPVGLSNSVQAISYVLAMQSGLAVYVLSIKRTSVLMVVLLSALVFKETGLRGRLLAVGIMLLGVFCISWS